ncbi:virulence factor [Fontibacillus panacisegetis]|uniref:Virulence factor n=1 Tax=Fontibacillus panacisegetis TaxID=670482 RepID=A0A1G7EGA7_9BACL|nr:Gfo/Idh/MocA family oxidoreductase [Fontibacillus panacisegetis]SDE62671.1 virulence factor [Fontibacillus panacisegetis]
MRIAIIGLGDIAQKAYLPVITAIEEIELVFCTRNTDTLEHLSAKYRVPNTATDIQQVIDLGVDAAFIHTATESHVKIAEQLIRSGIHVYVDKPISYDYEESLRLAALAEEKGVILMVGFNRRYAPMVAVMKEQNDRRFIMLQKNRKFSPDYARRFIYDDFIHVVDTIRFLAGGEITDVRFSPYVQEGKLYQAVLHFEGNGFVCTGIMNRDSGANEEVLEVICPGNKWVVDGLNSTVHYAGGEERHLKFNDWDPVLYRRGFVSIIQHFIDCVREGLEPEISVSDALKSHEICEMIVKQAEANGGDPLPDGLI